MLVHCVKSITSHSVYSCTILICTQYYIVLIVISDSYEIEITSLIRPLIQDGYTALRAASINGHTDVVRLLITRRATVNITDKVSRSCDKSVFLIMA